jgi:hypothetical protein
MRRLLRVMSPAYEGITVMPDEAVSMVRSFESIVVIVKLCVCLMDFGF